MEAMKNWKVKLTARGKTCAEMKILRGIFQGDALSSLLFVIAMMPLNDILRKSTGSYKFTKSQEKINHLMDDIKLFTKNEKELETLIQTIRYSQDIGMEFVIEKFEMVIMRSGKRQIMEEIELLNQERMRML